MSDLMQIPASDYGLVRLFAIEAEDAAEWDAARLSAELQASLLPEGVEIIDLRDLAGLGLAAYLIDGQGVDEELIEEDRALLDRLEGHVAILRSTAFGGLAQDLSIAAPLRWIGSWPETMEPTRFEPLPDADALGTLESTSPAPPAPSTTKLLRLILMTFGLVIALVLVMALGGK